ncbi:MAG: ParE family toxin-like protein [Methylobacter sp.]
MKSFATPDFWKAYEALPQKTKDQVRKSYRIWKVSPFHPSLHFKKVGKNLWSIRITLDYRALALKKDDDYYWIWLGTHDEYELFLRQ